MYALTMGLVDEIQVFVLHLSTDKYGGHQDCSVHTNLNKLSVQNYINGDNASAATTAVLITVYRRAIHLCFVLSWLLMRT